MKTIEFKPDSKSTIIPPGVSPDDEAVRNEVLLEVLPLIFHKLKNKLTPILGYAQILKARNGDDFSKERLERIERNTTELTNALNALKDYPRPASSRRESTDLGGLLESMATDWQGIATAAQTRVILELACGLPELALNAGQMRVLLLNLADNALQALQEKTTGGREIRISARLDGNSLRLSMRDNGRGMGNEEMASAWTPFFSNFPGRAGLGLVICEKIIADHGAACAVRSQAGEFSCFEIDFPLPAANKKTNDRSRS